MMIQTDLSAFATDLITGRLGDFYRGLRSAFESIRSDCRQRGVYTSETYPKMLIGEFESSLTGFFTDILQCIFEECEKQNVVLSDADMDDLHMLLSTKADEVIKTVKEDLLFKAYAQDTYDAFISSCTLLGESLSAELGRRIRQGAGVVVKREDPASKGSTKIKVVAICAVVVSIIAIILSFMN